MSDVLDALSAAARAASARGPAGVDLADVRRRARRQLRRRARRERARTVAAVLLLPLVVAASALFLVDRPSQVVELSQAPPAPAPSAPLPRPVPPPALRVELEAEDGDLDGGMERRANPGASGGAHVEVEEGDGDGRRGAHADLHFSLPARGRFVLWARVNVPDSASNAFHVSIDDGPEQVWHVPGHELQSLAGGWTWICLAEAGDREPTAFDLEPGEHRLRVRNGEAGAQIDRILLTTDPGHEPT